MAALSEGILPFIETVQEGATSKGPQNAPAARVSTPGGRRILARNPNRTLISKRYSIAREFAARVFSAPELRPQRLKPSLKKASYRSRKPLRHPNTGANSSLSAAWKAMA
jgi:hypothetical protein